MSSSCDKSRVMDFLYEELAPGDVKLFEAHLEECPSCAQELQDLKQTRVLLQAIPQEQAQERLVFTSKPTRTFSEWWKDVLNILPQRTPARLAFGLASFAVIFLLFGSLANLEVGYTETGFQMSMGVIPRSATPLSEEASQAILARIQSENERYIQAYLTRENERQSQAFNTTLASFGRDLDRRYNQNFESLRYQMNDWQMTNLRRQDAQDKRLQNMVRQVGFERK